MAPKAAKKKRWVRAQPLSHAYHTGDRQGNAVESAREDFFAEAFRLSPYPIGITELETGLCLEINDACLEIFGFSRDEVVGNTTLTLQIWPHPRDRARFINRLNSEGSVKNLEVSMRTKKGTLRRFLISTNLITVGGKRCLLTIGNDITAEDDVRVAHDQSKRGIRESIAGVERTNGATRDGGERFPLFIEHAPAAIAMFDRDMRYLAASRRWMEDYRLTGDIVGQSHYDMFPDVSLRWKEVHRRGLAGEVLSADEDQFVRDDGSVQWITWDVRPWYSGDQIGGIAIATEDVTARVEAKIALHEREERSDQVIRLANFGIFDHDHRSGKVYWSPAMREIYGVGSDAPASLEGYIQLIHPEDREMVVMAIKQAHDPTADDLFSMEHRLLRPDGSVRWVNFRSWTLFESDGPVRRPTRTLGAMIDVTKRKQAEEALKISERRFASFMDNLHGFAWIKDAQGRYLYVNRLFQESVLRGLEWKEKTAFELWPAEVAEQYDLNDRKVRENRVPLHTVESFIQNGEIRHALVSKFPIIDQKGAPSLFGGVAVDITERKQAEEALHHNQLELHQQQVQLEELTSKLLTAQEHERQRIARDLHDDVSQRLAALVLEVASFERQSSSMPVELAHALTPIREQLEQLSDDVHTLAYRLHPSLLEHAGLRPAIEDHVHQVSRRTGLPIHLKIAGVPNAVPLDHATCLFRVMQESVQNVVKHAQATAVAVQLRGSSKGIGLSVTDNGKGFDPHDQSTHQQGLGLSSMEERLRQLQGFFRIQSGPANGTKVCAWVPCELEVI
ncbi:MAG: PAS domain S-box protein [Nitrospira sp. BO4]|jgi:PAS domain S-box-containing protein|nr:PAS domain S-box protein [Nitrospira sp. BO4]